MVYIHLDTISMCDLQYFKEKIACTNTKYPRKLSLVTIPELPSFELQFYPTHQKWIAIYFLNASCKSKSIHKSI